MKDLLKFTVVLSKSEQKSIYGGLGSNFGPVERGVCALADGRIYYVNCDQKCDDGTDPICGFGDDPNDDFCERNPFAPGCEGGTFG